jgi:hypothetical protein
MFHSPRRPQAQIDACAGLHKFTAVPGTKSFRRAYFRGNTSPRSQYRGLFVPVLVPRGTLPRRLRSGAQVAILVRQMLIAPIRARRMTFWERPAPALTDRMFLGRRPLSYVAALRPTIAVRFASLRGRVPITILHG